jgi:hypothetical protein
MKKYFDWGYWTVLIWINRNRRRSVKCDSKGVCNLSKVGGTHG